MLYGIKLKLDAAIGMNNAFIFSLKSNHQGPPCLTSVGVSEALFASLNGGSFRKWRVLPPEVDFCVRIIRHWGEGVLRVDSLLYKSIVEAALCCLKF